MGKWMNWNLSSQVQQQQKVTGLWGMQYRYAARLPALEVKKNPPFKTPMPMTDEEAFYFKSGRRSIATPPRVNNTMSGV